MKIDCRHGYFRMYPEKPEDISRFQSIFELTLVPVADYYTFQALELAKNYSIEGGDYLGEIASVTFEGEISEVFRKNGLVFDFTINEVVLINIVSVRAQLSQSLFGFTSSGLLVPGTVREDGQRVTDYSVRYRFETQTFRYDWVSYA